LEKRVGATWVTRTGIHVDSHGERVLIRRFIDQSEVQVLARASTATRLASCVSTCSTAEFTHQEILCSFEGCWRALRSPTRAAGRSQRSSTTRSQGREVRPPDNAGFEHLINGIAMRMRGRGAPAARQCRPWTICTILQTASAGEPRHEEDCTGFAFIAAAAVSQEKQMTTFNFDSDNAGEPPEGVRLRAHRQGQQASGRTGGGRCASGKNVLGSTDGDTTD